MGAGNAQVGKHSVNPWLAAGPESRFRAETPRSEHRKDQSSSSSPAQTTTVMGKIGGVLTKAGRWSLMTALLLHEPVTVWGCLSSQCP